MAEFRRRVSVPLPNRNRPAQMIGPAAGSSQAVSAAAGPRRTSQSTEFGMKSRALFDAVARGGAFSRFRDSVRGAVERIRPLVFSSRRRRPLAAYTGQKSEVGDFLSSCRQAFWGLAVFSGLSNILMLTGSFFMLEVYDRVLPSRSVSTLIALLLLATILYAFQGALDLVRTRISGRIGRYLEETLGSRVYDAIVRLPLKTRGDGDGLQPLRDIDQVRGFLSSGGPTALFDIPWMPLYLGICFYFHFWIGVVALIGACVLVVFTVLTEIRTKGATKASAGFATSRNALASEGRRNAEVLRAMGMRHRAAERWHQVNMNYMAANEAASDAGSALGGMSKVFRMILQSGVLAVGAFLVIHQEATAGIIIASSILTARALAPVEMAIANWKGFTSARQAGRRLDQLLTLLPKEQEPMELPAPERSLSVDRIHVVPPSAERPVLYDVSFALSSGQGLGIIGPSGSGKSSLARALVGVWPQSHGKIRIDNAALDQWSPEALGQHLGYLPQGVELFDGSIAANIARFDPKATAAAVLGAARAAGVHELILSFPDGYGTRIGEGGTALSAGQRQRIALARAFYGDPFLVVLDEPSSNLDSEGEAALTEAILNVRRRGGIVIVVTHRLKSLDGVDHVLVIADSTVKAFGERDEVLNKVLRNSEPVPMRTVAEGGRK
ncbi:Type I secretion system ATPase, PrtD [Nitrobacter hamburgensis X14]|uniref:Type I secretion system ATPase, PrtD n=1 Tax=Nitrobacter hamburgensis (strain DSM 10229 / NCIMB 13809 / X14) TaxID=323097 RepID=Q1QJ25_NITHX|nr:Type I secretion system ATPase, PrtD [Nitrobacter hamburgensis X14]